MRILLLFMLAVAAPLQAQPENPGPYTPGSVSVQVLRGSRVLNTTVWFPSVNGTAQPDTLHGPYPVIIFGHGFLTQVAWYASILRHLASHGFIVAAPQFPDTQHGELADDMIEVLKFMHSESRRQQSQFYKLCDTLRSGVTGHSMGGGASLLAATRSRKINLAAPFAPAETTPSVISVINTARTFLYILAGQSDGITPTATNQQPMYNGATPFKVLLTLKGANHTKFIDNAALDFSDPRGYLSRSEQLRLTRRYLTSAARLVLYSDTSYTQYITGPSVQADTQVTLALQQAPVPPSPFTLISPPGSTVQGAVTFTWHESYSLFPGSSVRYVIKLYKQPSLSDSTGYKGTSTDTVFTFTNLPAGIWYWQVTAFTSDTTFTIAPAQFLLVTTATDVKNEIISKNSLQVYPNPASAYITVTGNNGDEIVIYSIEGKEVVRRKSGSNDNIIPLQALPPGVYLLRTDSGALPFVIRR